MPRVRRSETSPGSSPSKSAGETPQDADASVEPSDETHPPSHPQAHGDDAASDAPAAAASQPSATDPVALGSRDEGDGVASSPGALVSKVDSLRYLLRGAH